MHKKRHELYERRNKATITSLFPFTREKSAKNEDTFAHDMFNACRVNATVTMEMSG